MALNIMWMAFSFILLGVSKRRVILYQAAKAFIMAELVAALAWHLYCLTLFRTAIDQLIPQIILVSLCYLLSFLFVFREEKKVSILEIGPLIHKQEVTTAIFTALAIFIMSNIGFIFPKSRFGLESNTVFITRTLMNFSGLLLLFIQENQQYESYLRQELIAVNATLQLQYQQYKAHSENNELISRKVHDFKHQLALIRQENQTDLQERYFQELESSIQDFEAKIETGNAVLDTILSQKNRYCLSLGINFTAIVQGNLLNFMDVMDISALFGNALDNAIEAVEKIGDKEKRLITLKVAPHNHFVIIRLDNYDLSDIKLSGEKLPLTSKTNTGYHGYGLKSIKFIAQKYDGNMTLTKQDNWVTLKIVLPRS
ncbi:ATP-binding protein [Streptococcus caprae]|uniref:ATP-binding protein n=1 Tax=Streptococcus caprae TaxID=1640501 RepID=A0ABV8CTY6_9STRE